jgi:hypothetical protein
VAAALPTTEVATADMAEELPGKMQVVQAMEPLPAEIKAAGEPAVKTAALAKVPMPT